MSIIGCGNLQTYYECQLCKKNETVHAIFWEGKGLFIPHQKLYVEKRKFLGLELEVCNKCEKRIENALYDTRDNVIKSLTVSEEHKIMTELEMLESDLEVIREEIEEFSKNLEVAKQELARRQQDEANVLQGIKELQS